MHIEKLHQLLPGDPADEPLFVSTRDSNGETLYQWHVVLERGLSSDYGLFMPASLPCFTEEAVNSMSKLSYPEMAWLIMRNFLPQDDITDDTLADICEGAYSDTHIPVEEAMVTTGLSLLVSIQDLHAVLRILPQCFWRA